ncbi:MAG: Ig-like domain-containing protein [candidate division WOR-3 bacterium]|uniref:Uncharacterized protein n=1 Tax=candidate division WOR-3 bacterium TaxID=2052148 RepID=A0A7V4E272_UNCW3
MNDIKKIIFLMIILNFCAKKMPPPGKPDTQPPDVEILNPSDRDTLEGEIEIKIEVKDKSKIIYVEVFSDDKSIGKDSIPPYIFKFLLSDSVHFLRAKAIDEWDNIGYSGKIKIINKGFKRDTLK